MKNRNDYYRRQYQLNKKDISARIIERNLKEIIDDVPEEIMIENLANLGMIFTKASYRKKVNNSTLAARALLKFMVAAGKNEFTLNITKEELRTLNDLKI